MWGISLIGYVTGKETKFVVVRNSMLKAWRINDVQFHSLDDDFFVFKFSIFHDSQHKLEEGPWFINGHPLVLKRWSTKITLCKEDFKTIPVWVKFPNLSFYFR